MCGIAGFVGPEPLPEERERRCLPLMERRGPDHAAVYRHRAPDGRHVHLLHSRLSILDLDERANQPFRVGSRVLVYNGELYNYVEIRSELEGRGERFHTTGDTEVLARLLALRGWDGLDRCEGMWAFALYDEADGGLLLGRDRFGEKPLYLLREDGGLYFGSEIKFIQALRGRRLEVNPNHLYRYMVNGYKDLYKTSETFFRGIEELPPSTVLRVESGGCETEERYWWPRHRPEEAMSYREAVEGARERLLRAVRLRLRADVPLAFCMSGGVDSNSLISIARREFDYDVHGFTIVNTDERYEEQDMVDCMVRELDLRHTSIAVDTVDFLPRLRALVRQHDAPVATITYYAHWLLMESVAEHGYRISVSGSAADELFSGYFDHHLLYLKEVADDPDLHRRSREAWERHVAPIVRNPFLQDPDRFVRDPGFRDHIYLNAEAFASYLREPWCHPFREVAFTDDLLRNRMMNELFHEATPVILHEDDLNAMFFSIENRSPFLDRELFDFCYRIPTRHLVRDGAAKAVLRDATEGIVPEPVRTNRRKVGFNAPIHSFLDTDAPEVRDSLLGDSPVWDHVRKDGIEALLAKDDLPNSESKFLFYFLNTKIFLEEFGA